MRADRSLVPATPPRCLFIGTGEDIPTGRSLRARMFIIELAEGDISTAVLTECQALAAAGVFAGTMASFLRFVAPRYEELVSRFKARIVDLRTQAAVHGQHRRAPTSVAGLYSAFEIFVEHAESVGALCAGEGRVLRDRCWEGLLDGSARQVDLQRDSDPVEAFFTQLEAALSAGAAHVSARDGTAPSGHNPQALGWRTDDPQSLLPAWRPQGMCVGWIDDDGLYIHPKVALSIAQKFDSGAERIALTARSLIKRIAERGMLLRRDAERVRNLVRVTLSGGKRVEVLHVCPSLVGLPSQSPLRMGHGRDGEGPHNAANGFGSVESEEAA